MKFYRIDNQVIISDKSLTVGTELTPNTTDGAFEKHVPVINISSDGSDCSTVVVHIGSVEHTSIEAHYIEFIVLETNLGIHTKWLKPGMKPEAVFRLVDGEKAVAAFEYCNLHRLWKAEA